MFIFNVLIYEKGSALIIHYFQFSNFPLAWLDNKMALSYGAKRALKYSLGPTAAGAALCTFYKPYTMEEDDYEAMLRNRTARPVSRKAKGKLGQAAIANDHRVGCAASRASRRSERWTCLSRSSSLSIAPKELPRRRRWTRKG